MKLYYTVKKIISNQCTGNTHNNLKFIILIKNLRDIYQKIEVPTEVKNLNK